MACQVLTRRFGRRLRPVPPLDKVTFVKRRPHRTRRFPTPSRRCEGGRNTAGGTDIGRRRGARSGLVEVAPELAAAGRVTELAQRQSLELADPLAGHAELLADFLERAGPTVDEPEP